MIFNTIAMILYALVTNWLLGRLGVSTWMDGAMTGGAVGLLMAVGELTGNLFAGDPMSLTLVDGSCSLVLFALMGALIGGWQKKQA